MHLGFVVPDATGHLNPTLALARELVRRGHQITLFAAPRSQTRIESAGFCYSPIGVPEDADGSTVAAVERLGQLQGAAALLWTGRLICRGSEILLRDLPNAIRTAQIDGLLVDQVCPAATVVAQRANLPFVVVCNALAVYDDPVSPPATTLWRYRTGRLRRLRNRLVRLTLPPMFDRLAGAGRTGISPLMLCVERDHGLAVVAQQPAFFDFPQAALPPHFHYTGPWQDHSRDDSATFEWDRLDGRPLVYASLGTVQNRLRGPYEAIFNAARKSDFQFVVALGSSSMTFDVRPAANTIVAPYAPQLQLLKRATVAVTHAGLNTALECLTHAVPMVCVPITNDQPGVARRVEWLGAGELLPVNRVTSQRLATMLNKVIANPGYADAARRCSNDIANAKGLNRAAEIILQAFSTGSRVMRK